MSIECTPRRWGLGPKVDPDLEARVEHIAARESVAAEQAWVPGYIEFTGAHPLESLHALMAQVYRDTAADAGGPPPPPKLVREIRSLTTDPECGIALPMSGFMPGGGPPARPGHGTPLEHALQRLDQATQGRLTACTRIGLAVVFDLEAIAGEMRPMCSPDLAVRKATPERHWTDEDLQRALFGDHIALHRLGVPKIGLSGAFSPQLADAQRLLQTPPSARPQDYGCVQTGKGTIVGVVDFGCDFAHPSFRTDARPAGSRILELWDQNESSVVPGVPPTFTVNGIECGFGYGRLFVRADIEAALARWLEAVDANGRPDPAGPYALLGYHPHANHYTAIAPGLAGGPDGAHGTYVLEAAAGGRRTVPADADPLQQPCGVAPDADIVFVQVRVQQQADGRRELELGDVLDAIAFIFQVAEREGRPCAVNLSLNTMSGPHDGEGHFDLDLATLLRTGAAGPQARGRAVVIAAGNLPNSAVQALRWQHVTDDVTAAAPVTFQWRMAPKDVTRNVVEIWYDATDTWLQVTLDSGLKSFGPVLPGQVMDLDRAGQWCGSVAGSVLRDPGAAAVAQRAGAQGAPQGVQPRFPPGRHLIRLELSDVADVPVLWTVRVEVVPPAGMAAAPGTPVRFHAWLERDDNGPSGLSRAEQPPNPIEDRDRPCTIGTLSCAPDAIVVGGYSTALGHVGPWTLSGHGPSRRSEHLKPDLVAPACHVALIRSCRGNGLAETLANVTGTSVAAPFVTGTIACIYERKPDATLAEVRAALVGSAQPLPGDAAGWRPDVGHGRLNPAGALACFPD